MARLTIAIWLAVLLAVMAAAVASALSSCTTGGTKPAIDLRADKFTGDAPTSFSGPDGDNVAAQDEASAMVSGRSFDFTPTGFVINSGAVNSEPDPGSDYGIAGGSLSVAGDAATVDLDVLSNNSDVTNATLSGTFSLGEAQSAIVNPGRSFTMNWTANFEYFGFPVSLSFAQELTGSDFVQS